MSADVVPAFPLSTDGFTGGMCENGVDLLFRTTLSRYQCRGGGGLYRAAVTVPLAHHPLTLPARPSKRPVDYGRAEEPLRNGDPD